MTPHRTLAAGLAAALILAAGGAAARCPAVAATPPGQVASGGRAAPIDAETLLTLHDIKGFAPSPDGRRLLVVEQTADPVANTYRTHWLLTPSDCSGPGRVVDDLGRPPIRRAYGSPHGWVPFEAPAWSPDGRWVAYRKEGETALELWVADAEAGRAWRVPVGAVDVDRFRWSSHGTLLFRIGLDHEAFAAAMSAEQAHGFLYDQRFHVSSGQFRPMTPDCVRGRLSHPACRDQEMAADLVPGAGPTVRPATAQEAAAAAAADARPSGLPVLAPFARDPGGRLAWAANADPAVYKGPYPLLRLQADGRAAACAAAACVGRIEGLWWRGREVILARRESGVSREDTAPGDIIGLYRWTPGTGRVSPLLRTSDLLAECQFAGDALYCLYETSRRPAVVVRVDLDGGRLATVRDPNPGVAAGRDIAITKTYFTDPRGHGGYYYRVSRSGPPGVRHPVVIVQYDARGFLRGGTGDEYPIFALAEAGYVVLAFNNAVDPLQRVDDRSPETLISQRAATVQTLEAAVDRAVADGLGDPTRVAITGLSSGSETLHYALQTSDRFTVGIASDGALELDFLAVTTPQYQDFKSRYGTDRVFGPNEVLSKTAWSVQPDRLRVPLLVNVSEREFLRGFEGFAALRDAGRPLEVRVFPDIGRHVKYEPRNRRAVYRLNLDWLAFWLRGEIRADPTAAAQYARWMRMRDQLASERKAASAP